MDIQLFLVVILSILTISLVAVSVYIIIVFRELRETIETTNLILDDVEEMSDSIVEPVTNVADVLNTATGALSAFTSIRTISDFVSTIHKDKD